MPRPGRFLVLCLLLVLLPLRGVLAAGMLGCEPMPAPVSHQDAAHAHHGEGHTHGPEHHHAAKPCKWCAPCCVAAAPPPVMAVSTSLVVPATRAARASAEAWVGIVPPLPDPPPRA
ncbi:MAG: hypothetical protein EKK53_25000 [Burkholderiales bacterium]|nr:MAG: hypothetical protein EKK53_25000 [Burkholderiales bacterium]